MTMTAKTYRYLEEEEIQAAAEANKKKRKKAARSRRKPPWGSAARSRLRRAFGARETMNSEHGIIAASRDTGSGARSPRRLIGGRDARRGDARLSAGCAEQE